MTTIGEQLTADAQTVIDASRTEVKTLITPVHNVKGYRAKGDGVTDDSAAIQEAIDAVPPSGGVVYFPAGTYIIGSTIYLSRSTGVRNNTILMGMGAATQLVPKQGAGLAALIAVEGSGYATSANRAYRNQIRDMYITNYSDRNLAKAACSVGILAKYTSRFILDNVTMMHFPTGIEWQTCYDAVMNQVELYNCGDADLGTPGHLITHDGNNDDLNAGSNWCWITDCTYEASPLESIRMVGRYMDHITISGCKFHGVNGGAGEISKAPLVYLEGQYHKVLGSNFVRGAVAGVDMGSQQSEVADCHFGIPGWNDVTLAAEAAAGQAQFTLAGASNGLCAGMTVLIGDPGGIYEWADVATVSENGLTVTLTANLVNTYAAGTTVQPMSVGVRIRGAYPGGRLNQVNHCTFEQGSGDGYGSMGVLSEGYHAQINQCQFRDNLTFGTLIRRNAQDVGHTQVNGCNFFQVRGGAIWVDPGTSFINYGVINGCVVSLYGVKASGKYDAIRLRGNSHLYTISGCDISGNSNGRKAIAIEGQRCSVGNCIINGGQYGIDLSGAEANATGNTVTNASNRGISLGANAKNCVVTGNRVTGCGNGIVEVTGADKNTIVGNNVSGNTSGQIITVGASTVNQNNVTV